MKRSKFSLSHYKLFTCKMGQLVPVAWYEAIPGDTIQMTTSALIRCAPLNTAVMHNVSIRFHHWFVPNRLLWANWQDFITGGATGTNASAHPYVSQANATVSSLADYLGAPTSGGQTVKLNALPYRAYNLIWNEFYRDEDLQTALTVSTADGADGTTFALQNICWEKDYLTSSRPWAVKGNAITMPLGSRATVMGIGVVDGAGTGAIANVRMADGSLATRQGVATSGVGGAMVLSQTSGNIGAGNLPNVFADLSTATAVDINTVRHAFALQRYQEARARYGSRYTEYLRAAYGVRCSDARLQRPEYLGGGRTPIQFSEVLQTGVTTSGTPGGVGTMFGHGISAMRTNRYRRFFEEHGIVMTLMSVRPKTMYSQRVKRGFIRGVDSTYTGTTGTKEDYWQRELQHIGQQAINPQEVDNQTAAPTGAAFGYQDRYDEYRREESSVAGLFRSTLNTWHLARDFAGAPSLNSAFVSCTPSTRIFQDVSNDNLYVCANHNIQARRVIAREGTSMTF